MHRIRRVVIVLASTVLVAGATAGCSAAEDVASQAGDAASQAARDAALQEARNQICPLVQDRQLSDQDRETLSAAVELARTAGAESEFLTTVEDVAGSDGTPPETAVAELADECAATP